MTELQLNAYYNKSKSKINKAINFIEKHKSLKDKLNIIENSKALINNEVAKEKIRILFISSLNATGARNLTLDGPTSKNFYLKLDSLSAANQIPLDEFFKCFDPTISNFTHLYEYLHKSKELKNFAKKKTALFLYKLNWLQNNLPHDQKIFKDYPNNHIDLIIPLDIVIVIILNKLLNLSDKLALDQTSDFDLINKFFKSKLGEKFILIEDFWFWGFFITKGKGKVREVEFNEDKFYTAEFIQPTQANKELILEFLEIVNSK